MQASNHLKNIAIIGAGGNSGLYMTEELLKTGKHTVTALTRPESTNKLPEGVIVKKVDYSDHSSLVEALKGQDALIITLSVTTPPDTQPKIIKAAAEAGVGWILPNEWSPDTSHEGLRNDVFIFAKAPEIHKLIVDTGKSSFIAVTCSFWYEWSLAIPNSYGFDFDNKTVTFFDDGKTKINTTTWPQVGRAVAALLSLPIKPEGNDKKRSLEHFRNKQLFISSFLLSQEDMLESVLRVTKGNRSDWKITNEPAKERYAAGIETMKKGDRSGFVRSMYTRVFYPDGCGNYEASKGLDNDILGLPKEDLDTATEAAIKRAKEVKTGH